MTQPTNPDRQRALLEVVTHQLQALRGTTSDLGAYIPRWRDRTTRMFGTLLVPEELEAFTKIATDSWEKDRALYIKFLEELEGGVRNVPQHYVFEDPLESDNSGQAPAVGSSAKGRPISNKVFIVHGHDSLAKVELARTLEKLKLAPIVLHEQPNEGKTIIEKFERDASSVSFAVVLLTPDDSGYPKEKPEETRPRARQNVVLELGYFSGTLGRSNVCVLYKGDVEVPSDYLGVVYVNMDDGGAWRFELAKELKQAGLAVDLNDLL